MKKESKEHVRKRQDGNKERRKKVIKKTTKKEKERKNVRYERKCKNGNTKKVRKKGLSV